MKFKVGDMVIGNHPTKYTITRKGWIGKVTDVYENGRIRVCDEANGHSVGFSVDSHDFDLYEDTFDFNVGAELAMERLMEKTKPVVEPKKPETPKYYNGKVVCIGNLGGLFIPMPNFTVGKIYEVVDGVITTDSGYRSNKYNTLEVLSQGMGRKFIPLVEDVKEDKNEPLTTEELMKLDGQKVWLSSIDNGKEDFTDAFCGWYTVDVTEGKLNDNKVPGFYKIKDNGDKFGFKAYLTPPKEVTETKK